MDVKKIIKGKKILIVDDELDVLESLYELLYICKIDAASSFEEAKLMLEKNYYDVAILDIMGVNGFDLLEIAKDQKIPVLMLTAHVLNKENIKKSAVGGAAYFAPKEKMEEIDLFLADVLIAIEMKKSSWQRWFDRLGGFFDTRFNGTGWREEDKEFWEKKAKYQCY